MEENSAHSTGRRNTVFKRGIAMGKPKHGRCRRGIRPALGSIGHPGAGLKGERQRFWKAIAVGMSTDDAAIRAGVSTAAGVR